MKKINAVGDACPIPVIKMKKALEENQGVEMLVDNEIAAQNLKKLAVQKKYDYAFKEMDNQHYLVTISKVNLKGHPMTVTKGEVVVGEKRASHIVVIDSDQMGGGNEQLGRTLLKGFIYALSEQEILPKQLIMYNGGVKLAIAQGDSFEDFKKLEAAGVKIYLCGACVDFYQLSEQVAVGEITNMYHIVELLSEAEKIIKP